MKNIYKIPPVGQRVGLGDSVLHTYQLGEGKPTVIFENGLGGFALQWSAIQPQIAHFTRTISYDRAGQGWSDVSAYPRTPQQMTQELHQLLDTLHLESPYILVAHSFGGLISRYFAHQYPDEIKGMVLVDTSHEMQLEKIKNYDRMHQMMLHSLRVISLISRIKFIGESLSARVLKNFRAHISEDMWKQSVYLAGLPKHYDTLRAEMSRFGDFFGQANIIPKDFGDLPIIVVTAAESILHEPPRGGLTSAQLNQAHQEMQAELSRMSSKGQHISVPSATHLSLLYNPTHAQYVIDAISQLLDHS